MHWDALLPHAGPMRMITELRAWDDATIVCASTRHLDPANPLRVGGLLPGVCGLEFGAQAMAIHGALLQAREGKPRVGYLVAVRDLACARDRLDDLPGPIEIRASRLLGMGDQVAYAFSLSGSDGRPVMSGRASVVLSA